MKFLIRIQIDWFGIFAKISKSGLKHIKSIQIQRKAIGTIEKLKKYVKNVKVKIKIDIGLNQVLE